MIQPTRIQPLNPRPVQRGRFVLYWMQASQRAQCNHALEHAIQRANALGLPLLVCFALTDRYPGTNLRHKTFLLQGLRDVDSQLASRGIPFVVRLGEPTAVVPDLAKDAALVVCDRGYLRLQQQWRRELSAQLPCALEQVESDCVVPVETVSDKEEFAARTIRPRITRLLAEYLVPLRETALQCASMPLKARFADALDVSDPAALLSRLKLDAGVPASPIFVGGSREASRWLTRFVREKLAHYHDLRGDPSEDYASHMSPYLHFGHISPLEIALAVGDAARASACPAEASASYIEELIVRRELSCNFVTYNPRYDTYDCLPAWAKLTLAQHASDPREYLYTHEQLDRAQTHDPYWNAAQREMVVTGKMHNYMRMYWGKKILEWSPSPQQAFDTALQLNNRYQLDGRDPNSYTGVAWCFGKHDRPWTQREVFGTIRYMNAAGLERKFDIAAYCRQQGIAPGQASKQKKDAGGAKGLFE